MNEYPYVLRNRGFKRHGQSCRMLLTAHLGEKVQIQFEDGETMVVDRFNLAGHRKKYSSARGRPPKNRDIKTKDEELKDGDL